MRPRRSADGRGRAEVLAETETGWTSVLARGVLEHRSTVEDPDARATDGDSVSRAERELEISFYHVFDAPGEMTFALVRLETGDLTGVVEASDDR
jgi:hypothetical protein